MMARTKMLVPTSLMMMVMVHCVCAQQSGESATGSAVDAFSTTGDNTGAFVDVADASESPDDAPAVGAAQPEGKSLEDDADEQAAAADGSSEDAAVEAPTDTDAEGREDDDRQLQDAGDDEDAPVEGFEGDLREGGHKTREKVRRKPVFVPVPLKVKKKKDKIVNIAQGMYIPGGQPLYGKFKGIKSCAKACSKNPGCFAADYDKWLHKCFIHTNTTACGSMQAHPSITHLAKVPCFARQLPTTHSRVILGAQMYFGYEMKGIDDLKSCIKKCTTMGGGIASSYTLIPGTSTVAEQLCVAINFDFSTHRCYIFPWKANGALELCTQSINTTPNPDVGTDLPQIASKYLVANPFVVTIFLCPNALL